MTLSSLLREIPWLVLWTGAIGTLSAFFLRWLGGDQYLAGRLAGYFMPWLLAVLIPFLALALLGQRKWLALTLTVPIVLILAAYAPLFFPAAEEKTPDGAVALQVMTYNIWSRNRDMAAAAEVIRQERPDILMLQEVDSSQLRQLRSRLRDLYPEEGRYAAHDPELMQAVISRFPVVPLENLRQQGQAQKVRIEAPPGPVTVFNVHPLRHGGWGHRYGQIVSLLKEEILDEPGATILAGDFNVNDQTQLYRKVTRHLHDAHWQAGFGFGFTFPSKESRLHRKFRLPPLIRIDHIFYSPHFTAQAARTLPDAGGSDHFPVVATLLLSPSPPVMFR